MVKTDITNRTDINALVSEFYKKVRAEETLGPFFNRVIKDWPEHIERLTDFWEASIFLKTRYYGNPLETHVKVDRENDHQVSELHFGLWLNLWVQTINEMYEGDYAENAKARARKMGTFLFMNIFQARQDLN